MIFWLGRGSGEGRGSGFSTESGTALGKKEPEVVVMRMEHPPGGRSCREPGRK